eukprot:3552670-Prymnesium_polylepis.2
MSHARLKIRVSSQHSACPIGVACSAWVVGVWARVLPCGLWPMMRPGAVSGACDCTGALPAGGAELLPE